MRPGTASPYDHDWLTSHVRVGTERPPTERQRQIWRLFALGKTSREIAADLGLAVKTVDVQRQNLLSKLGARNVADLTRAAVAAGVIQVDVLVVEDAVAAPAAEEESVI